MYESQLICKDIIEQNWLEFLRAVKKQREEDEKQRADMAVEHLKRFVVGASTALNSSLGYQVTDTPRYYLAIDSFWQWYLDNKV